MTKEIEERLRELAQKRHREAFRQRVEEVRKADADELIPLSEV